MFDLLVNSWLHPSRSHWYLRGCGLPTAGKCTVRGRAVGLDDMLDSLDVGDGDEEALPLSVAVDAGEVGLAASSDCRSESVPSDGGCRSRQYGRSAAAAAIAAAGTLPYERQRKKLDFLLLSHSKTTIKHSSVRTYNTASDRTM